MRPLTFVFPPWGLLVYIFSRRFISKPFVFSCSYEKSFQAFVGFWFTWRMLPCDLIRVKGETCNTSPIIRCSYMVLHQHDPPSFSSYTPMNRPLKVLFIRVCPVKLAPFLICVAKQTSWSLFFPSGNPADVAWRGEKIRPKKTLKRSVSHDL